MSERTSGYAQAIVQMAEAEGSLDTVENELLTVGRAIDDNEELREKLTDIHLPIARRMAFVDSDALRSAHQATRAAVAMLVAAGRAGDTHAVAREVARRAAESRDRELAEVQVAVPLDASQRERLRAALEDATGRRLEMKVVVDPDVIGGVRATVGDTVIDDTVARRLHDVRSRIAR